MTKTFLTQSEHVQTVFEKKYLEMMGGRQERRVDLPGLSPQLIAKNTELENIQAELAQAIKDQEKWDAELEENKARVNEQRMSFEQIETQNQEILKRLKQEIDKYVEGSKKQFAITKTFEDEFEELTQKEATLQNAISQMNEEITNVLQPYADYFEDIVLNATLFENTDSILNRYKSLNKAKEQCADNLQGMIRDIKSPNRDLKAELEKLTNNKIEMSHSVSTMKEEIEKLQKHNRYVQMNVMKDAERVTDKESEYVTILSSIDNIASRVLSTQTKLGRIYTTHENLDSIEAKLDLIEKRFQDIVSIVSSTSTSLTQEPKKHSASSVFPPKTAPTNRRTKNILAADTRKESDGTQKTTEENSTETKKVSQKLGSGSTSRRESMKNVGDETKK